MLTNIGTLPIETPRLLLRRFTMDDAEDLYKNLESDKDVAEFMLWEPARDRSAVMEMLNRWIPQYDAEQPSYNWAIVEKESGEVVGNIRLNSVHPVHLSCEAAYLLAKRCWGKGYMTEAFSAVIDYAFTKAGINRIMADYFVSNPASGKVMEKCGLRFEGVVREKYFGKRGFEDMRQYAILKRDYIGS